MKLQIEYFQQQIEIHHIYPPRENYTLKVTLKGCGDSEKDVVGGFPLRLPARAHRHQQEVHAEHGHQEAHLGLL